MQEPSKLISLRLDFNIWSSISTHRFDMAADSKLKLLKILLEITDLMFLLEDLQILLLLIQPGLSFDSLLDLV